MRHRADAPARAVALPEPTTPRRGLVAAFAAAAVVAGMVALSGCAVAYDAAAEPGDVPTTADGALDGRTFVATDVHGIELPDGTPVTLTFEDGRVAAWAGLNRMSAAASWDQGHLDVDGPFMTTMMAGPPELEAGERWLVALLESDPELRLDDDALVVDAGESVLTLVEGTAEDR